MKTNKIYNELHDIFIERWKQDNSIFCNEKQGYVLDLENGFIVLYPGQKGKINILRESVIPVFRTSESDLNKSCDLHQLLKEIRNER